MAAATIAARADHATRYDAIPRVGERHGPIVQAHGVFVAGRKKFDVTVRELVTENRALVLIFSTLPLMAHGWDHRTVRITRAGTSPDLWPIWRLERD